MADLADTSIEALQSQIEKLQAIIDQRKQEAKIKEKPKPVDEPDFGPVIKLAQNYIDELAETGYADENFDWWMFETAMNVVFGLDVWEWTKPILRGDVEYANNND